MSELLIAVAVDPNGQLSPHAGRARHWRVFALPSSASIPEPVWEIALTSSGTLHEWHVRGDGNRHPLHSVDIAIAGSAGDGVIRRLADREVQLITTAETDPMLALTGYLRGDLPAGGGHDESTCLDPHNHQTRQAGY
ncbi:nitrogen fixation protein [Pseudomaricurvus sp. HS19]|uniref:NifB/NifX family molybdenum-iron cluster-binding protein n=1 Tax=Pseudomaricurvus sp. HS19 TaxID=2692626 RepID=UPI00136A183F|nr:nitrogen fixation protein [Pseudomaricurvus sp. HS19]MYM62501.1 nitrogen fixation protein [Pseudomaricurvus sp. HS19]